MAEISIDNIDRTIFMLWLGDEVMNENRIASLNNLSKYNVKLITKDNIDEYILKDYPLHPAYNYLSTVHKSDYLRCYLMYHYGGGYSDVKSIEINWDACFDKMDQCKHIMMMGVKTIYGHTYAGIEEWDETMKHNILSNMDRLFYMGYFICRAKTPIVIEWYNELHARLDRYLPILIDNPATFTRECFSPGHGCAFDRPIWENPNVSITTNYPISWNILLAQILYPLQYKYLNSIDNTMG